MNTCWNLLSSLPPPARGGEGEAPQAQQRLIAAERERIRHDRERVYFSQSQQQQAAAGLGVCSLKYNLKIYLLLENKVC